MTWRETLPGPVNGGIIADPAAAAAGAGALVGAGVFLAWLRVALGYHTAPQVIAGYAMGACTAAAWLAAGDLW